MALIKIKRGASSNLTSLNLEAGEPAYTTDSKKLYIGNADGTKTLINPDTGTADKLSAIRKFSISGDGTAAAVDFNGTQDVALALVLANSGVSAGTYTKLTVDEKGRVTSATQIAAADIPNLTLSKITDAGTAAKANTGTAAGNVPVLNSKGELDENILPALTITDVFEAASQAAMLALSEAERGDVCIRTDISKSYILKASPSSTLANWVELRTPENSVLSVNGDVGAVVLTAAKVGAEPAITAGTTAQYRRGDKTWQDFAADVRAAVLTGLSTATNAAVTATDTVLAAIGKLQAQINARLTSGNIKAGSNVTVSANGNDVTINATVPVTKVAGKTGDVTVTASDVGLGNVTNESKATMFASAALTGTPTAPTAAVATDSTQIATTAFVKAQGYLTNSSVIDGGTF